jgi:hypothetical protein
MGDGQRSELMGLMATDRSCFVATCNVGLDQQAIAYWSVSLLTDLMGSAATGLMGLGFLERAV